MGNASLHARVLFLGIDDAGKSTMISRFHHPQQEVLVQPTEAYVIRSLKVKGVKLNIWDVSGRESTRSLWKHYYSSEDSTDAVVWVVDGASTPERLEESARAFASAINDPALKGAWERVRASPNTSAGVILYFLVNKSDLASCRSLEEVAESFDLGTQRAKRLVLTNRCSGLTGEGLKAAFEELSSAIRRQAKEESDRSA